MDQHEAALRQILLEGRGSFVVGGTVVRTLTQDEVSRALARPGAWTWWRASPPRRGSDPCRARRVHGPRSRGGPAARRAGSPTHIATAALSPSAPAPLAAVGWAAPPPPAPYWVPAPLAGALSSPSPRRSRRRRSEAGTAPPTTPGNMRRTPGRHALQEAPEQSAKSGRPRGVIAAGARSPKREAEGAPHRVDRALRLADSVAGKRPSFRI